VTGSVRAFVPRPLRRAAGRVRASLVGTEVAAELQRVVRSRRPIVVGPWLGEVGFEVLYWVPWLRWFVTTFGVDAARVVALSRGGVEGWYRDVAGRYLDVFDYLSITAFREGNQRRLAEIGEQKQLSVARFEREILTAVVDAESLRDAEMIHPALMYRLFQPYWWKHAATDWVMQHAEYSLFSPPALPSGLSATPGGYTAVKFYVNDCMPADDETQRFVSQVMTTLADAGPVVSLRTDLALDDHAGAGDEVSAGVMSIAPLVTPRNNLAVQTAVLANARAFVGTYGGFSYLPAFHGVPTTAVFARRGGFDPSHLAMATCAFARVGAPRFELRDIHDTSPGALAALVMALR
jgi:hypothetical protein